MRCDSVSDAGYRMSTERTMGNEGISHLASSLSTGCIYRFVAFHIMYSFGLYYPYDNNNDFFGLEIMKMVDGQNG